MIGRLLCAIGRHAPSPDGLWNQGYCFTQCRRCGRDMVRSAFGEWHVPRNHRIVWRPPADGRAHDVPASSPPRPTSPERARWPLAKPSGKRGKAGDPFDFGDFEAHPADATWPPDQRAAL